MGRLTRLRTDLRRLPVSQFEVISGRTDEPQAAI